MELPLTLRQIIDDNAAALQLKRLLPAAANISARYRSEDINGSRAASTAEETAAYSAVRMPATFGAAAKALALSAAYIGEVSSALDAGAGTGAAAWAAAEVFDGLDNVTCLEREPEMIKIGEALMKRGEFPAGCSWERFDLSEGSLSAYSADIVTASYVLNELKSGKVPEMTEKLWSAAKKALVIVEPGTMSGYRNIMEARDRLISLGAHIAAPCPHGRECPLPDGDWCHFTVRVPRSKLHKQLKNADVPYEDEKFCFITAVREDRGSAAARENTKSASRVLRHPVIASGNVTLSLCTADGLITKTVTKKDGALFKKARKSDCGDEF